MRFFLIFLLLPIKLLSQDIEGVWTGNIYNDSTKKYIPYEIAITNNKGKLSGYSNTIFTGENHKQETGVKSLKVKRKNDKILVEDDELIYNNYADAPPKGVKQFSVLNVMRGDSGLLLIGVFNTNRTKEYASLTGTIHLQKKEKISETKIMPRLDELKLSGNLSFIQNKEKENIAIAASPAKTLIQTASQPKREEKETVIFLPKTATSATANNDDEDEQPMLIAIKEDTINYKADVIKGKDFTPDIKTKKQEIAKATPPVVKKSIPTPSAKKTIVSVPESVRRQIALASKKDVSVTVSKKTQTSPPQEKTVIASAPQLIKTSLPANNPTVKAKEISTPQPATKKPTEIAPQKKTEPVIATTPKAIEKLSIASAPPMATEKLAGRKLETIRTVNFKSDSLTLTLYDNGVVDGDTVSVILNGKIIMPKQGLSTNAITKTIYITPDLGDSLQLVMYAENLGSIPPNTGLLIIQDGEDRYQIRFAGDLQKNSAIVLKRNKALVNDQ